MSLFLFFSISTCISEVLFKERFESGGFSNYTNDKCEFPILNFSFGYRYNFTLQNCKINDCHAIIDRTYDFRWGDPGKKNQNISKSAFFSVNIVGARFQHKPSGIIFKPTQSTIEISLQMQTCHNFYVLHPFEPQENCFANLNISNIIRGLPMCKGL